MGDQVVKEHQLQYFYYPLETITGHTLINYPN